jgi:hypothetical protein
MTHSRLPPISDRVSFCEALRSASENRWSIDVDDVSRAFFPRRLTCRARKSFGPHRHIDEDAHQRSQKCHRDHKDDGF